jgi:8-oxo-dGTP pyrophosphatase MutT (NUDIX family)
VQNDAGDLLLIQRSDNGRWALPGGGHDLGESIGETVRREVREETGLEVEVTDLSGVYTDPGHIMLYDDGEARQQFSLCFHAWPIGGELRTSRDSVQLRWVPVADLPSYDVHPRMRVRIDHAVERSRRGTYIG